MIRPVALLASGAALCAVAAPLPADAAVTTLSGPMTVEVRQPREPQGVTAKAGVLIDTRTGRVLWTRKREQVRPIASTTKIMTALVAMDRSKPSDVLRATNYRAEPGESLLGLKPGERMKVRDLLTALMLASANDAADTLAAGLASSRADFVVAMNRRARSIGLRDTRFGNPVGLDNPRTVSTAADLARLTQVAMRDERFAAIVGRSRARLRSGARPRTVYNRNELVGRYRYVDGVKTGHTLKAGYVLVGAASLLDGQVISVVLGEPSIPARNRDTLALLRHGRAHFKPVTALPARRTAITLQTTPGDNPVPLVPRDSLRIAAGDGQRIKVVARTRDDVRGPLEAGTRLGTAWVERDGRKVDETALVTATAVAEPTATEWLGYVLGRALPLLAILVIGFMMIVALLWRRNRSRDRSPAPGEPGARAVEF